MSSDCYPLISANSLEATLSGNPFSCEWLVKEVLESKNVHLGRNYVVATRQNVLEAEGIQCFDTDGITERRLIVVESKLAPDVEVS